MSRPISEFPQEVLQVIFKHVKGKDAARCRAVCSGWMLAIDNLSDKVWKEFCIQDFEECFEAYRKANITWRELYKSLTLWPKLPSAKMSVKEFVCPEMVQFCVLHDRLGISQYEKTDNVQRDKYDRRCHKIVYYDLDTLEKKSETIFDFVFDTYSENDNFIVVIETLGSRLCVIPKSTMEKVFVATIPNSLHGLNEVYTLFENSVYFENSDFVFCTSKLVDVDGRPTVVTESLCELRDEIITISQDYKNHINVLLYNGEIYSLKQNKLKLATKILQYAKNVPVKLKKYGFNWSRESVNDWIESYLAGEVCTENVDTFWKLGDIFIMGTGHRVINIYHNHSLVSNKRRDHIKPTHSVDLNKLFEFQVGFQKIHQIDAVEVPNGHKVIVYAVDKLIVLEFLHECEGRKRKDVSECRVKRKKNDI